MHESIIRVLVADDFEPWRRFTCSTLRKNSQLEVIDQASNGLEAIDKARNLRPDLVLLDIGMPKLNGLEAARRIRVCSPNSRILFVSENHSSEIAEEGLRIGASGYVLKSEAGTELLVAVRAVIEGKQFVSSRLYSHGPSEDPDGELVNVPGPSAGLRLLRTSK